MSFFLTHIETIFKGFAGLVMLIIGLVWRKNLIDSGYEQKENEIAEANLEAVKKSKEAQEAIKNLSDDDLDKRLRDSLS